VIRTGLDAKACGANALLVTPVFYHGATEEGNFQFYRVIGESVQLPLIIYNVVASN
jgi:dihydrodipicolinate synthase/N-acetylneuraminate lyase